MSNVNNDNNSKSNTSSPNEEVVIIDFDPSLAYQFKALNIAWLKKYFVVEPIDEEMLSNPASYIIDKGGHIFFAKIGNQTVGTFALIKAAENVFELSKMAVDEQYQGQKIGNHMLAFCLQKAKSLNANKIILYSNTILIPAIHLYQKYGFTEIPIGSSEYKRSNIKMEVKI